MSQLKYTDRVAYWEQRKQIKKDDRARHKQEIDEIRRYRNDFKKELMAYIEQMDNHDLAYITLAVRNGHMLTVTGQKTNELGYYQIPEWLQKAVMNLFL